MFVLYAENSRFFPAIFSFFAMELLKTNKGFATIPFNTFFSKEEFFRAIEETHINPFVLQYTPTVEGFLLQCV
jgi:hypothetical protein